jgi:hypothetical protein
VQNPARIDHPKTASGPESSFSLTRQAQTPVGSQAKFCLFSETPDFRVLRPSPPARPILRGAQRNFPNRRSGADWESLRPAHRKDLAAAAACDVRDSCWLLRCCLQLPPARRRPAAWLARGIASRLAGRRGITGSLGPAATGAVAQHHSCAPVAAAAVGSYGIWCS